MGDITLLGLNFSGGTGLAFMFLTLIALGANAKLFMKCEQPIWAAFVPGYNVVVAMRILGRPDAHALLFLVPVFNVYFFFKTVIELAQAFGKHTMTDFVLAAVFNVFYVLNLSLAWQEEYEGPVYGKAARQSSGLQTA
jgi:signal peptidase I